MIKGETFMKKLLWTFIGLVILIWSLPAFALPVLQLDIGKGYYNTSGDPRYDDETIVSAGDVFTLYALLKDAKVKKGETPLLDDTYYISMALFPSSSAAGAYGSFTFAGNTIDVTNDMIYGQPSMLDQSHGIYPT
jgi:hypothetical protein